MIITTLVFQRTENGKWENGVAIGRYVGDIEAIVDAQCKLVKTKELWNYKLQPYPDIFLQYDIK